MIERIIHAVLIASLISSIFAIIFMNLRNYIARYIGPTWNYYAWFSLLLPWFAILTPVKFWYIWTIATTFFMYEILKPFNFIFAKLITPLINGGFWSFEKIKLFFIIWLCGAISTLLYIIFRHLQFTKRLKLQSSVLNSEEREKIKLLQITPHLDKKIYLSSIVLSPLLCHLFMPRIYLPQQFFQIYNPTEQKYILQHEYYHFKRCDLLANTIMLILGCLNWFNPFIFFAYRYFRYAQELSCDAKVSQKLTFADKKIYGVALVKTALQQTNSASLASCWWGTGIEIKERCHMLKFTHTKLLQIGAGLFLVTGTLLTALVAVGFENRDAVGIYSLVSARSSDFVIRIFNNSHSSQFPLSYSITPIKTSLKNLREKAIRGELFVGDDHGEYITIPGTFADATERVELLLYFKQQIMMKADIRFSRVDKNFYFNIQYLNPRNTLAYTCFSSLQAISFNLMDK